MLDLFTYFKENIYDLLVQGFDLFPWLSVPIGSYGTLSQLLALLISLLALFVLIMYFVYLILLPIKLIRGV